MVTGEKVLCECLYKLIQQNEIQMDIGEFCSASLKILKNTINPKYFYAVIWTENEHERYHFNEVGSNFFPDLKKPVSFNSPSSIKKPVIRIKKRKYDNALFIIIEVGMGEIDGHQYFARIMTNALFLKRKFIKHYFELVALFIQQREITEQNRLFQTIVEHSYNAVEVTDEEAKIEYVNPAFEKVTQYQREEAIGQTVASLLRSPEVNPNVFEEIKTCVTKGEVWKGLFKSLRKNRTTWHALATVVPFTVNGTIIKHIAIKQDMTEQKEQSSQLKASEQKYRQILNATMDPIVVHDLNGRIVEVNQAACKVLKYTRDELLNFHIWDIDMGISAEKLNQICGILKREPLVIEGQHRDKDGHYFPVEIRLSSFIVEGARFVISMIRDISEKKIAEAQINKLTSAVEQSPVLVFITDTNGIIEYANAKVIEKTEYALDEVIGGKLQNFFAKSNNPLCDRMVWNDLHDGKQWQGELSHQTKEGKSFWVSARLSPLRNKKGDIHHCLAVMEDITQKKSYEAMLTHQALSDHLTHLPNRFYGINHLENILSTKKRRHGGVAVFFLDLDSFKKVNDTLGHSTGDKMLKEIAARFVAICRPKDMIVRLGGDEFMMIIEDCSQQKSLKKIAQKFLEVCMKPVLIDGYELLTTASIGISLFPNHGMDAKSLMSNADTAMYESKKNGKNCWTVYHKNIHHATKRYIDVKAEIIKAFERDELQLHYQPIVNIETNQIIGAESLLRWQHATLGYVDPEQAIMVAEEIGFIHQLGIWVLEKACCKARLWNQNSLTPLFIAVNISPTQLKNKLFAKTVDETLRKNKLLPRHLYLELTENALIDNSEQILRHLNTMNKKGIQCTIDDFGAGYSSLNYLKHYPFKCLKIDKSFIHGLQSNSNDIHLVNSIIAMCQNLNLTVIAEGVETLEQLEILKTLGCKYMQGWYFDSALNENEFSQRLMG